MSTAKLGPVNNKCQAVNEAWDAELLKSSVQHHPIKIHRSTCGGKLDPRNPNRANRGEDLRASFVTSENSALKSDFIPCALLIMRGRGHCNIGVAPHGRSATWSYREQRRGTSVHL